MAGRATLTRRVSASEKGPTPRLERRPTDDEIATLAREAGVPPVTARVLSGRNVPTDIGIREFLNANISTLDDPEQLKDIEKAAKRIARALEKQEVIGLESDYDQDGLGAMSTMWHAFTNVFGHPEEKLKIYVGHRLRDGYGVCTAIADRIIAEEDRPTILITADNGSSDEERIERLALAGVDVIVTDHHALPKEGPPRSAFACINPQRADCLYPDGSIAGGMVAWLLMCMVRKKLIALGAMKDERNPLGDLLDYVACSTVADCVSMASKNNRALVKYGLRLMNGGRRECWNGMKPLLKTKEIKAETIAFGIAPRVNAQTRLNSAEDALRFLLAEDEATARSMAGILDKNNEERKAIEREMVTDAIRLAEEEIAAGSAAIVMLLTNGHPGVQGICSSRIMDRYGRPTFSFCRSVGEEGLITGSGRSIDSVHLRDVLQQVDERCPGMLIKFGGHKAAAGATLEEKTLETFKKVFIEEVAKRCDATNFGAVLVSDGELSEDEIELETLDSLEVMEPTGRGFEGAQFDGMFEIQAIKPVGDQTHLKMAVRMGEKNLQGIWFRATRTADEAWPVNVGEKHRLVYKLMDNKGYGRRRLELQILGSVEKA